MSHSFEFVFLVDVLKPLLLQREFFRKVDENNQLYDLLAWYWNRELMSWSVDETQVAHGVCLIRLFRELPSFLSYVHDPCGEFVFIELLSADTPNVMQELFEQLFIRHGEQKVVLWDRGERTENGTPRMYTWSQFMKLARRLTYGLIQKGETNGPVRR